MTSPHSSTLGPVAHIQTNLEWGGGENQVYQLLREFKRRGTPAMLWAHPDGELLRRARTAGLDAHPLPRAALRHGWFRGLTHLRETMAATGVSLLHTHDSEGLDLAIRLKRLLRVPLVYSRRVASPVRPGFLSQRKYSMAHIDTILAISKTVREVMIESSRYPADRIAIAPTGVDVSDLDRIEPDPTWRTRYGGALLAGGLGRLAPKKNWAFLVHTAAACRDILPDLHWIVAGDGPERDRLIALTVERGVDDRVHFVGFQPDGARLLKSLDLLFFPSLREGASVTIREAMILGVPVAAVNAAGSMESLAGHGWPLESGDTEGAVAAVREIIEDPARRQRVIEAARASALERFSFERTADDTWAVYQSVLESTGAP